MLANVLGGESNKNKAIRLEGELAQAKQELAECQEKFARSQAALSAAHDYFTSILTTYAPEASANARGKEEAAQVIISLSNNRNVGVWNLVPAFERILLSAQEGCDDAVKHVEIVEQTESQAKETFARVLKRAVDLRKHALVDIEGEIQSNVTKRIRAIEEYHAAGLVPVDIMSKVRFFESQHHYIQPLLNDLVQQVNELNFEPLTHYNNKREFFIDKKEKFGDHIKGINQARDEFTGANGDESAIVNAYTKLNHDATEAKKHLEQFVGKAAELSQLQELSPATGLDVKFASVDQYMNNLVNLVTQLRKLGSELLRFLIQTRGNVQGPVKDLMILLTRAQSQIVLIEHEGQLISSLVKSIPGATLTDARENDTMRAAIQKLGLVSPFKYLFVAYGVSENQANEYRERHERFISMVQENVSALESIGAEAVQSAKSLFDSYSSNQLGIRDNTVVVVESVFSHLIGQLKTLIYLSENFNSGTARGESTFVRFNVLNPPSGDKYTDLSECLVYARNFIVNEASAVPEWLRKE